MTLMELRKMAKLSRAEMCKKYGIPLRTAEDWEAKNTAPQYVLDLLERAIREDFDMTRKYYVMLMSEKTDDECELLATVNVNEARKRAQDEAYYIERDGRKGDKVEIRLYTEDIEDEECTCFDYDTIDF